MIMFPTRTLLAGAIMLALSTSTHAAGFALASQAASSSGNAFAGPAAVIEDASAVWFNPAGMTELHPGTHATAAGHVIIPKAAFTDKGSWVNPALTNGDLDLAQAALTGNNDDGGKAAPVPNTYVVRSFSDALSAGIGINAPFGLGTKYADDWIGRYNALESGIKTINVNPSMAYQVSDQFSIGAGVSAQYIHVELKSAIDSSAACRSIASAANSGDLLLHCLTALPNLATASTDSKATISGDDVSMGFNAGALYKPNAATKVGFSYRSAIDHELEGDVKYDINASLQPVLAATGITRFNNANVTADANLPASAALSVGHQVNDKLEVMGDFTRTYWSSFESLTVKNAETAALVTDAKQGWVNSNRYAVGANYQYNDRLKLRAGVALDETPVPDAKLRTPRTPDTDRTWLAVGANYKLHKGMSLDLGYAHIFMDETPIDNTNPDNGYAIRGLYDSSVDILSAQLNMSF